MLHFLFTFFFNVIRSSFPSFLMFYIETFFFLSFLITEANCLLGICRRKEPTCNIVFVSFFRYSSWSFVSFLRLISPEGFSMILSLSCFARPRRSITMIRPRRWVPFPLMTKHQSRGRCSRSIRRPVSDTLRSCSTNKLFSPPSMVSRYHSTSGMSWIQQIVAYLTQWIGKSLIRAKLVYSCERRNHQFEKNVYGSVKNDLSRLVCITFYSSKLFALDLK